MGSYIRSISEAALIENIRQRNKFREKSYDHRAKSKRIYLYNRTSAGCAESVRNQADYACKQGMVNGTKKALIIGCSTGYGLASRICALENCGADTLGIMFERQANGRRTATPGWYNTADFIAWQQKKVPSQDCQRDAFSKEIKDKAIELIKKDLGKVDLVVYSLAAPRRTDSEGKIWSSCLKTTGEAFTEKSLDLRNNEITEKTVEPATEEEVLSTVKVMGGEDWADWIDALKAADVLTENAVTVAYSYIGTELTYPIYYHGTIGTANSIYRKQCLRSTRHTRMSVR